MNHSSEIKIEIPSRIHATLLAMDSPIYRINGGVGFAVDLWNYSISVTLSDRFIVDQEMLETYISGDDIQRIVAVLNAVKAKYNIGNGVILRIQEGPPRHIGLGSGTALLLGSIEAYLLISGISLSSDEIIELSCRGGTSGVGVETYFQGGCIFDGGHRYIGQEHMPSRAQQERPGRALTISRVDMPDWKFGVFLPTNPRQLSGDEEVGFFRKTCPIPHREAASATYHALFGIFCSVMESNFTDFCRSINEIQATEWKSKEIHLRGEEFRSFFEVIKAQTSMVGLSSLGPLLYFTAENLEEVIALLRDELESGLFEVATVNNIGRTVRIA